MGKFNKIGTKEDFLKFASDRVNMPSLEIEQRVEKSHPMNFVYPGIVEERPSEVRSVEMNVFSKLIQNRIIFLSDEVSHDSMDTIIAQLLYLDSINKDAIYLYINSGGGECYSGLSLCSTFNIINSPVSTTILGHAASMGAVIASSGAKGMRYALPYSRFMIHQPLSAFGYQKYSDSRIALKEMESVRNDIYDLLATNSGKSFDEVIELCENGDKWMKPQEAIDLGFIDGIIKK